MSDYFSIDTRALRQLSEEIKVLKAKYDGLYEDITNLVVNELSLCWVDDQYDAVQEEYRTKHSHTLEDLSTLIHNFSESVETAANDADQMFGR